MPQKFPKQNFFTYDLLNWRVRMLRYLMDPNGLERDLFCVGCMAHPGQNNWQELVSIVQDKINACYTASEGDFRYSMLYLKAEYDNANRNRNWMNDYLTNIYGSLFRHTFPSGSMDEVANGWKERFVLRVDSGGNGMINVLFAAPNLQEAFVMVYDAFLAIDPHDPHHYWRINNFFVDDMHTSVLREFVDWAPPMDINWTWNWGLQGLDETPSLEIIERAKNTDELWWEKVDGFQDWDIGKPA